MISVGVRSGKISEWACSCSFGHRLLFSGSTLRACVSVTGRVREILLAVGDLVDAKDLVLVIDG